MSNSKLYLIPTVISEGQIETLPLSTIKIIHSLKYFIVERARTARRFIKLTKPPYAISDLEIVEFSNDINSGEELAIKWLKSGFNVGVISESGMPGIADPGQTIVRLAHQNHIAVESLVGPSSINLALSASGLNGQDFAFKGYLPIKDNELKIHLRSMEKNILKNHQTQIFIETPYRNNRLIKIILSSLSKKLLFCIASDLTGSSEFVKTQSIGDWKRNVPQLDKVPTIFLLGI